MNNILSNGQNFCDELSSSNKNDYFTNQVIGDTSSIIKSMSKLEDAIKNVQNIVNAKKVEVAVKNQNPENSA